MKVSGRELTAWKNKRILFKADHNRYSIEMFR
jgi:hypothetical protein